MTRTNERLLLVPGLPVLRYRFFILIRTNKIIRISRLVTVNWNQNTYVIISMNEIGRYRYCKGVGVHGIYSYQVHTSIYTLRIDIRIVMQGPRNRKTDDHILIIQVCA